MNNILAFLIFFGINEGIFRIGKIDSFRDKPSRRTFQIKIYKFLIIFIDNEIFFPLHISLASAACTFYDRFVFVRIGGTIFHFHRFYIAIASTTFHYFFLAVFHRLFHKSGFKYFNIFFIGLVCCRFFARHRSSALTVLLRFYIG